jgi:hypothetical protein
VSAKDIILKPITSAEANALVRRIHYSGKVAPNSQIHIGVFYNGKLEGALQFGPSMDKRKTQGLVRDTPWNGFVELNRMAFSDALPRNSESRAIGIALKMLKKHAPHLEWVISFADGTQCGDGTIYRASGFVLTQINRNKTIWRLPDGEYAADINFTTGVSSELQKKWGKIGTESSHKFLNSIGAEKAEGFQLRYVYFLKPEAKERLTVPILSFDEIEKAGAKMYKGSRPGSIKSDASDFLSEDSGATPTSGLQPKEGDGL